MTNKRVPIDFLLPDKNRFRKTAGSGDASYEGLSHIYSDRAPLFRAPLALSVMSGTASGQP
jgi:hypothetical protein